MSEQLKFEVGKCYRTRDGRKATVLLVRPKYMVGEVEVGEENPWIWGAGGGYYSEPIPCDLDLVAEWREPARVLVTLYRNTITGVVKAFVLHNPGSDWQPCGSCWLVEGKFVEGQFTEGGGK